VARISTADYETVTVACDHCGENAVFNRREDFSHIGPYAGENVVCPNCRREFRMMSDTINPPYELFVFSAREFFRGKRYMQAITSMAQAWELFFSAFAAGHYIYRPFFTTPSAERNLDKLNTLQAQLDGELRRFTFWPLRNLVINTFVQAIGPQTMDEAATAIGLMGSNGMGNDPKPIALSSVADPEIRSALEELLALTIGDLRNNVTHHRAYRPLRSEVERCLEDEVKVLYRAQRRLGVRAFGEFSAGIW
jgi:hypothetical protein